MNDANWNQIRSFLAVVEFGNLSRAAQKLGLSQPTIGRQISALESSLNAVIFDRIGKDLRLTELGHKLAETYAPMLQAADRAAILAKGANTSLEGNVTLTATDFMCFHFLPAALEKIAAMAPNLVVTVLADNHIHDIARREADIAIRNLRPSQEGLIAQKLGTTRAFFYASKSYLSRMGRPQSPEDFAEHRLLAYDHPEIMHNQLKARGLSIPLSAFRLACTDSNVLLELTKRGHGISILPENIENVDNNLQRICADHFHLEFETWITTHRELKSNPAIRLVYDVLVEVLRQNLG